MAAKSIPARGTGGVWPRVRRFAARLLAALLILFALSLAGGRFLPVASTLMFGRWLGGEPVSRIWVPLRAISPHLLHAVITSEDQRYCSHWGVDFSALREVLEDEEGPRRGASTIPMQVAKNLYLWPGRSYLRKGLEIPLALAIDLAWGKQRTMEIYLNIAEWGEGIFGAESAARRHFGKSAAQLTPGEAARLAALLPNPILRRADRPGALSRRLLARLPSAAPLATCLGN